MILSKQLAMQIREVILNGNWISTNLKTEVEEVDLRTALVQVGNLNNIAKLCFHLNYYIAGVNNVFENGKLEIRDKYSFDLPELINEEDWNAIKEKSWDDAERLASFVENMTEEELKADFINPKFGSYYRNLVGIVEHSYYHLGQIVIIKKLIKEDH